MTLLDRAPADPTPAAVSVDEPTPRPDAATLPVAGSTAAPFEAAGPTGRRGRWTARLGTLRDLLVVVAVLLGAWTLFGPGRGARDDLAEAQRLIDRQVRVSERLDRRAERSVAVAEQGLAVGAEARDIARETRDLGRAALEVGRETRADVSRQLTISERLRELAELNDRRAATAVALAEETLRTAQLTTAQAQELRFLTGQLRDAAVPTAADVDRLIGLVESFTGPLPPSATP
jgi:hypothetical protein